MSSQRLYALLLRLYPETFRREYAEAMLEAFCELDDEYRHRRLALWTLILADLVRSASAEHARAVTTTMDAQWPTALVVGGIVGSLLFFGLFPGLTAVLGPLPGTARLLVDGGLVGYGLGWAQCATIGQYFDRRKSWLVASLASGIVGFRIATLLSAHTSPDRTIPATFGASIITMVAAGILTSTLIVLMMRGRRDVATSWLRVNIIALPLATAFLAVLFSVLHLLKADGELTALPRFLFRVWNPLVVTVAVGAITARPLWRLSASRRSVAHT